MTGPKNNAADMPGDGAVDRGDGVGEEMRVDYAAVNGLELYYEVHGDGEPLILLHGGVGAIEIRGRPVRISITTTRRTQ